MTSPVDARPRIKLAAAAAWQRDQTPGEPAQQVDARETLPLLVGLEQRRRLVRLDPAAPQRLAELEQAEVADEAALVAAEPLERDHADGPRADAALAQQPRCDCIDRQRLQPLEIERAAHPDERGAAARVQAEPPELRGREPAERLRGRRLREPSDALARRANDDPVELARAIGLDQLAAERPQQRARHRRRAERTQPARLADRRAEQRITREAAQELAVVVVQREHEAKLVDRLFAARPHPHGAVLQLPRVRDVAADQRT